MPEVRAHETRLNALTAGRSLLRQAAEDVLRDAESLSSFMEESLRDLVARRRLPREFVVRGLVSRDEGRRTREYFEAASVLAKLRGMLTRSLDGKAAPAKRGRPAMICSDLTSPVLHRRRWSSPSSSWRHSA